MVSSVEISKIEETDEYVVYVDGREKIKGVSFTEAAEWIKEMEDSSE